MKISLHQISPKTGDLEGNYNKIVELYNLSNKEGADLCIFPELALTGYLAEDLFLQKDFIEEAQNRLENLVKITKDSCLLIPTIIIKDKLYNGVIAAKNGKIIGQTSKEELPNYGVFDEQRYFAPGKAQIITLNNYKIGVPICEDIWFDSVCNDLKDQGAQILISVNASPFEKEKFNKRTKQVKKIYKNTTTPIIYCNQAMAQDGIILDGKSFCFDGELNMVGKSFEASTASIELNDGKFQLENTYPIASNANEDIYKAMVLGTRNYVRDNCFNKVVLGLSGGLDSAMVAAIAVDAIGNSNVSAIMLPSKLTSNESLNDAQKLADSLKIYLKTISIIDAFNCLSDTLNDNSTSDDDSVSLMHQNLQSRIRGTILMAESNKTGALLLTTGNKSEYATGYATIYGDMNGAFNPIKDLYKTELFALARYKNIIPESIINKEPSAELAPEQKDSDSLPPYEILDGILKQHIENGAKREELYGQFDPEVVDRVLKLLKNSEFKRRQSAPGVKISSKNFEKDWRYPLTNWYR
ncbi:MAG: NAD+ synthase [Rickettsiaceae bacterium]|nr:NAD+ synthase [Rickettsiaceae bacterium]